MASITYVDVYSAKYSLFAQPEKHGMWFSYPEIFCSNNVILKYLPNNMRDNLVIFTWLIFFNLIIHLNFYLSINFINILVPVFYNLHWEIILEIRELSGVFVLIKEIMV